MTVHKILCPLCFSGRVEPPLAVAVGLAKLTGAELVIVDSVYMPPVAFFGDSSGCRRRRSTRWSTRRKSISTSRFVSANAPASIR